MRKTYQDYNRECNEAYIEWMNCQKDWHDKRFNKLYKAMSILLEIVLRRKFKNIANDHVEEVVAACIEIIYKQESKKKKRYIQGEEINIIDNWGNYFFGMARRSIPYIVAGLNREIIAYSQYDVKDFLKHYSDELPDLHEINYYFYPSQEFLLIWQEEVEIILPRQINYFLKNYNNFQKPYKGIINYVAFCNSIVNPYNSVTLDRNWDIRIKSLGVQLENIMKKKIYNDKDIL